MNVGFPKNSQISVLDCLKICEKIRKEKTSESETLISNTSCAVADEEFTHENFAGLTEAYDFFAKQRQFKNIVDLLANIIQQFNRHPSTLFAYNELRQSTHTDGESPTNTSDSPVSTSRSPTNSTTSKQSYDSANTLGIKAIDDGYSAQETDERRNSAESNESLYEQHSSSENQWKNPRTHSKKNMIQKNPDYWFSYSVLDFFVDHENRQNLNLATFLPSSANKTDEPTNSERIIKFFLLWSGANTNDTKEDKKKWSYIPNRILRMVLYTPAMVTVFPLSLLENGFYALSRQITPTYEPDSWSDFNDKPLSWDKAGDFFKITFSSTTSYSSANQKDASRYTSITNARDISWRSRNLKEFFLALTPQIPFSQIFSATLTGIRWIIKPLIQPLAWTISKIIKPIRLAVRSTLRPVHSYERAKNTDLARYKRIDKAREIIKVSPENASFGDRLLSWTPKLPFARVLSIATTTAGYTVVAPYLGALLTLAVGVIGLGGLTYAVTLGCSYLSNALTSGGSVAVANSPSAAAALTQSIAPNLGAGATIAAIGCGTKEISDLLQSETPKKQKNQDQSNQYDEVEWNEDGEVQGASSAVDHVTSRNSLSSSASSGFLYELEENSTDEHDFEENSINDSFSRRRADTSYSI